MLNDADDYIIEYFELLDAKLVEWGERNSGAMCYEGADLSSALINQVFFNHCGLRDSYMQLRRSGISACEAFGQISAIPEICGVDPHSRPRLEILPAKGNQVMFYANGPRMMRNLLPFIDRCRDRAVAVSENADAVAVAVTAGVRAHLLEIRPVDPQHHLEKLFPSITGFFTAMRGCVTTHAPKAIVCVDGCQTQTKVMAAIARQFAITSVCVQQGWPSFLHTAFRRLPFDRYMVWGEGFGELLKRYNPSLDCRVTGYPHPIIRGGSHDAVTFFLQSPVYLTTVHYMAGIIESIATVARLFPERPVLYREHPDFKVGERLAKLFAGCSNVHNVSCLPIEEVYSRTCISVAHYSSCLIESFIHGCIPVSFDPTYNSRYNPDLEAEGIGYIVADTDGLTDCLKTIFASGGAPRPDVTKWNSK